MRSVLWFVKLNFPFRPLGAFSRILILCFTGLSFLSPVLSANPEDSLRKALVKATDDNKKVELYLSLAKLVKTDSPDSCLLFLDEAQKLFRHINSLYYLGEVNEIRGDISRTRNDFNEAVRYYKVAIYCYAKKGDKKQQVKLLNFIGGAYAQSGNLSEAFRNYLKAREFAEEIEDLDMQARINNNLGRIFVASEQYSTGIEYYEKALAVFQANADSFKMATVLMNLGAAFNHIQETDSSRICSNKAISIFKAIKKKYYLGSSYQIYAFSLITEKKYQEALTYLEKTLKIAEEPGTGNELIESKLLLSDVLVFSGITHYLLGDFLLASRYLRQGYHLSDSLEVMERSKEALEYLSLAYEKMGRTDSSYYFFKLFKQVTDSLNKIQSINIMKLAEVQMEYEKDVKENKMQLAYAKGIQNRNLAIFIGAAAILLSLIIILLMRLRLENQKKKQIRIEKRQAELEKEAADLKVEAQNKELATKVMHSTMVNEMVLRIAENLRKMEIPEDSPNGKIKNELVRELLNSTSKEDNWKEFEIRFQNVHTDFYKHLRDRYPDLTTNEIRLSALLRLNMTTKEISALTHQSERAIVLSRHRLRHKFGLQTSDNLVVFLSQF